MDNLAPVFCGDITIIQTFPFFFGDFLLVNVERAKPLERGIRSVKTPHQTLL